MTETRLSVPNFIARKGGLIFFLVLYLLAMVIFFFVYHPLGMFNDSGQLPVPISGAEYIILLMLEGYVVLIVSRIMLYKKVNSHPEWTLIHALLWVVAEFLLVDLLVSFTGFFLAGANYVTFLQMLSRVTVDLVGLYMIPMLTTAMVSEILQSRREYMEMTDTYSKMKAHADALDAELATLRKEQAEQYKKTLEMQRENTKFEKSLVGAIQERSSIMRKEPETPMNDLLRFIDRTGDFDFALPKESVLYVETADNYINVNYIDDDHICTRIIRNTMKAMETQLQHEGFIRCHRQYLVNQCKIKSISREKDGLVIHLKDCDRVVPIGKTYASQLF